MNKASKSKVGAAFHEVFHDKPRTVDTSKSAAGQKKQMVAIALSKARAAGADIPKMHDGGVVPADGVYNLQKGETVTPAEKQTTGYDETPHRKNPSGQQGLSGKCSTYSTYNDNVVPEGASNAGTIEHKEKYADTQTGSHDKFSGRTPPAASKVEDAKCQEGVGKECARKQVGGNVRNEETVSSFGGKKYKA